MSAITGMSRTPADGRFTIMYRRDHINQSMGDILTTPIGTRVMRQDYGSKMPRLIDTPVNQAWKLEVYVAVTEAIHKWEPRVKVKQVRVAAAGVGYVEVEVEVEVDHEDIESGEPETASARITR